MSLGPDLSRFSVQYDEDEYAYAVGPPGKPRRYLGITLVCFDCRSDEEAEVPARMAARDERGDTADLALLVRMAGEHWAAHHAPPPQ
jgi:hypothetical protein